MTSESAKRATAKYQREKMESISIRVKRDEMLSDRIKQAATARGIKPAQFIKQVLSQAVKPSDSNNPATPGNVLIIEYDPDKAYRERIQILIDAGIVSNVSDYLLSIIGDRLDRQLEYNGVSMWRYTHGTIEPRHA